ncbi:MAG: hypothetical protein IK016_03225, partial [Lachnospiraceae bacterium]|nr:hypothetical protein [Lachnospiraceae bacterium]
MQEKTRAKKSNKNTRPSQQVNFSLLTQEQMESAASRKELDVFIANPLPESTRNERISPTFLTVDADAFDHPRPLTKEMREALVQERERRNAQDAPTPPPVPASAAPHQAG